MTVALIVIIILACVVSFGLGAGVVWLLWCADAVLQIEDFQREANE